MCIRDRKSSGKLDFHLKKLDNLITANSEGKYTLTRGGYAALQAIITIRKYGWQRRAYMLNLIAYVLVNAFAWLRHPSLWLLVIFPATTAWIAFYSYWNIVKRKVFKMH